MNIKGTNIVVKAVRMDEFSERGERLSITGQF